MVQKDIIDEIFSGKKPNPAILDLAQKEMQKVVLPLGREVYINESKVLIKNVGDAINFKAHLAAIPITRLLLQKNALSGEDEKAFFKVRELIAYWYAREWIGPLPDYGQPLDENDDEDTYFRGDYKEQYLQGAKADKETIDMIASYIDFTMTQLAFSGMPGPFAMSYIHGVGTVSGDYTPVERYFQLIQAGGAKLAKDCFDLEELDDEKEIQQLYQECFNILLFWTMKGWLKLPDLEGKNPFA
ncbi:MAG: hypothetical protein ACTSWX_02410 [Promethearchaeota archaeon]